MLNKPEKIEKADKGHRAIEERMGKAFTPTDPVQVPSDPGLSETPIIPPDPSGETTNAA